MNTVSGKEFRKHLFLLCSGLSLIAFYVAISASQTVPSFVSLYKDFGAVLPKLTTFMLNYHFLGMFPSLIALIACVYVAITWRANRKSQVIIYLYCVISFLFTLAWRELLIYAVWQPILRLGSQVGL